MSKNIIIDGREQNSRMNRARNVDEFEFLRKILFNILLWSTYEFKKFWNFVAFCLDNSQTDCLDEKLWIKNLKLHLLDIKPNVSFFWCWRKSRMEWNLLEFDFFCRSIIAPPASTSADPPLGCRTRRTSSRTVGPLRTRASRPHCKGMPCRHSLSPHRRSRRRRADLNKFVFEMDEQKTFKIPPETQNLQKKKTKEISTHEKGLIYRTSFDECKRVKNIFRRSLDILHSLKFSGVHFRFRPLTPKVHTRAYFAGFFA